MIVNPQLFNYRLIISSLLVVVSILGVYSFTNYNSIKSHEEFLTQENLLLEKELIKMLNSYDELSQNYNLVSSHLQKTKLQTKEVLDSLRLLKSDISVITKFKNQFLGLKTKEKLLLSLVDSLQTVNLKLQKEKHNALTSIEKSALAINALETVNTRLNKTINKAAILSANNLTVEALNIGNSKKKTTLKANRVNAMDVCFYLTDNPLVKTGKKEIYIQIVSPNNNVIADKGEVFFDNTSLIYSKKEIIDYNSKNLKFCSTVATHTEDRPLKKGIYFVNVFHNNIKLGSTSISLR